MNGIEIQQHPYAKWPGYFFGGRIVTPDVIIRAPGPVEE